MSKQLKIAFVHDYIKEYGGAERVLESLHAMYPDAPVFTLVYTPQFLGPHQQRFKSWKINPSILQYIPYTYKFISIYRLIAPFVFKTFNFSGYDVIVVSATGAYNPNNINKRSAKLICYCHTPPRYLYGYATAREMNKNIIVAIGVAVMNHFLRIVDFHSAQQVDLFIANSQNVASRIKKFYTKNAIVIYPPVGMASDKTDQKFLERKYYLTGGRLARPKHTDLIVRVCTKQNIPLKVFGKGFAGYGTELKGIAGNTIEFLGEVSDAEKQTLMQGAKAFFFAAEDEDFGIVPVEAMSVGTPVIAYASGGVKESVIDGKTGVFFHHLTDESLLTAIEQFEMIKINAMDCQKQASKFSEKIFIKNLQVLIEDTVS